MDSKEIFESLGMSKLEAQAYDVLLSGGKMPVQRIIKRTGLKRPTAYYILGELVRKGLAQEILIGKKKEFIPASPDSLEKLLDKHEADLSHAKRLLSFSLPELLSQYRLFVNRHHIVTFEGAEGIKRVYRDTIEHNQEKKILVFRSDLDDTVLCLDFFNRYMEDRIEKGVSTKIISPKQISPDLIEKDKRLNRERKFWRDFEISAEVDIYDDKTAFVAFQKPILGTIIYNQAIADTMRKIFYRVWNSL